jgi:hypothetical protein
LIGIFSGTNTQYIMPRSTVPVPDTNRTFNRALQL